MSKDKKSHIVVGVEYHEAMKEFYKKRKVLMRYQVEMALDAFFKKEAPEIYRKLVKKTKEENK